MAQAIRVVNNVTGDDVDMDMTVEVDEGQAFIALSDNESNSFDICLIDPKEVDEFFNQIAELKKEWERVNWDGRRTAPGRVVAQGPGHLDRPNPA